MKMAKEAATILGRHDQPVDPTLDMESNAEEHSARHNHVLRKWEDAVRAVAVGVVRRGDKLPPEVAPKAARCASSSRGRRETWWRCDSCTAHPLRRGAHHRPSRRGARRPGERVLLGGSEPTLRISVSVSLSLS